MTGYGSARAEHRGLALEVEARSVNHRYLSLQLRCPSDLAALEPDIETLLRSKLQRGSVTVQIQLRRKQETAETIVDAAHAKAVAAALRKLAKDLRVRADVSLSDVLAAPGVFTNGRAGGALDETVRESVLGAVGAAVDELVVSRAREGAALSVELRKHISEMRQMSAAIAVRTPAVVKEHHARLRKRLAELLGGAETKVRDEDLAREIALIADRTDVTEELARLRVHLDEADALLGRSEPVGRRFEFLTQEMLREVNTTGSKSADAEISKHVIALKAELERVREQVANLE